MINIGPSEGTSFVLPPIKNHFWENTASTAGLIGLTAMAPMGLNKLAPALFKSMFASKALFATSIVAMTAGLASNTIHTALYGDKISKGQTQWQNFSHLAASGLGALAIASGFTTLLRRAAPPPIALILGLASFAADMVECISFATEVDEGGKSMWEVGLQIALVLGLNLSPGSRFQLKRGYNLLFHSQRKQYKSVYETISPPHKSIYRTISHPPQYVEIPHSKDPLQQQVYQTGQELLFHARQTKPDSIKDEIVEIIANQAVKLTMRDATLRSRLLRFTIALPQLENNPRDVVQVARDLFGPIAHQFPLWMRPFLSAGLSPKLSFRLWESVVSYFIKLGPNMMSRQFLGGIKDADLKAIINRLAKSRIEVTVDTIGEFATGVKGGKIYYDKCAHVIDDLMEQGSSVSIKLTGLTPHLDPFAPKHFLRADNPTRQEMKTLFEKSAEKDLICFWDAENYDTNALMYQMQKEVLDEMPTYDRGGFVVQGYLKNSGETIDGIETWARARKEQHQRPGAVASVRLVKGAYWENEIMKAQELGHDIPVYLSKAETDSNYRRQVDRLLKAAQEEILFPCFATHNPREVAYVIARAKELGVNPNAFEFQMLYGMNNRMQKAVRAMGYQVRSYVPHIAQQSNGTPGKRSEGTAYLGRRLVENGSGVSQDNQLDFDSDISIFRLNNVNLSPTKLTTIDKLHHRFDFLKIKYPQNGFRPAPFMDPAEPGRLDKFWSGGYQDAKEYIAALPQKIDEPLTLGKDSSGKVFHKWDPSTGENLVAIRAMSHRDVDAVVDKAVDLETYWSAVSFQDRAWVLEKIHRNIAAKRDFYTGLIMHEVKGLKEADADVQEMLDGIAYAAADLRYKAKNENLFNRYRAAGTAGIITPWNFPSAIPALNMAQALAAGCPVILKPSEHSPIVAKALVDDFRAVLKQANYPEDIVQLLLTNNVKASKKFARDERLKVVAFTGSQGVGLDILEHAGKRSILAELGGTNSVVVAQDADPDNAIKDIVHGAFGASGQKCSAVRKVFVPESQLELYQRRLTDAAESVIVGSNHDPQTKVGPVILQKNIREHREAVLKDVKPEDILLDGRMKESSANNHQIHPTVVINAAKLKGEEHFGPMFAIYTYTDERDVLKAIDESDFGLTGAVFTNSPRVRELFAARNLATGTGVPAGNFYVYLSPTGARMAANPFGAARGHKLSGSGSKTGGTESMMPFLTPKPSYRGTTVPSSRTWQQLAQKSGNDFRQVKPTELQLPGRADFVESTPIGKGLIVVDDKMSLQRMERLCYRYLSTGNTVELAYSSNENQWNMVDTFVHRLRRFGFSEDQINSHLFRDPTDSIEIEQVFDVSQIRWVHVSDRIRLRPGFYHLFRHSGQSQKQGFMTTINAHPGWLEDEHFTAMTQSHRVVTFNTAQSGDVEKIDFGVLG